MDLPTRLDLFKLGADYVLQHATKIDPAQVYVDGSDINLFTGITSQIGYQLVLNLAQKVNALMLDGAEDEDLDRYAWDRYQLTRKGASPAVGTIRIYRIVGGSAGTIDVGTKLATLSGVEYITTTTTSFGASTLSMTANVRAVQAGKSSQVGANTIRKFATPSALFDASLMVNNDFATAHGEDVEDDPDFRTRIRDFWKTVRRGVVGAIAYGARAVPGVVSAAAVEVTTLGGSPARVVMLYIADSSGIASAAKAQEVLDSLLEYRACGIQVVIVTAMPQILDITLRLAFVQGVDTVNLTETIRNAIVEFVNTLPVSGLLSRAQLYSMLQRYVAEGLIVTDGTLVAPVGDVVPLPGNTIRTTITNVTVVA